MRPLHIAFLVLAVVFSVLFVVTFSALIYHWVHRDTQNEVLRDTFRGLPNVTPKTVEVNGKVGMQFAYPDPTGAQTIYTVPAGKRAHLVGCTINNENGPTLEDVVLGIQDAEGQVFGVSDVSVGAGTFLGLSFLDMQVFVFNEGDRFVMWAENPDIYIKLDVMEYDATDKSPMRIGAVNISETNPFVWTATKPVMFVSGGLIGASSYEAGPLNLQLSVNDVPRDTVKTFAAATPIHPTIDLIEYGMGGTFQRIKQGLVLYTGDTLKIAISTVGAGPMTLVGTIVQLDGNATNPEA